MSSWQLCTVAFIVPRMERESDRLSTVSEQKAGAGPEEVVANHRLLITEENLILCSVVESRSTICQIQSLYSLLKSTRTPNVPGQDLNERRPTLDTGRS